MEKTGRSMAESMIRDHSLGYYGSIEYCGHEWVGDLKYAFIEIPHTCSHFGSAATSECMVL
ncbi:hypothetical protein V1515DRAFT_596883 [Lipomyces mesembrius]